MSLGLGAIFITCSDVAGALSIGIRVSVVNGERERGNVTGVTVGAVRVCGAVLLGVFFVDFFVWSFFLPLAVTWWTPRIVL